MVRGASACKRSVRPDERLCPSASIIAGNPQCSGPASPGSPRLCDRLARLGSRGSPPAIRRTHRRPIPPCPTAQAPMAHLPTSYSQSIPPILPAPHPATNPPIARSAHPPAPSRVPQHPCPHAAYPWGAGSRPPTRTVRITHTPRILGVPHPYHPIDERQQLRVCPNRRSPKWVKSHLAWHSGASPRPPGPDRSRRSATIRPQSEALRLMAGYLRLDPPVAREAMCDQFNRPQPEARASPFNSGLTDYDDDRCGPRVSYSS